MHGYALAKHLKKNSNEPLKIEEMRPRGFDEGVATGVVIVISPISAMSTTSLASQRLERIDLHCSQSGKQHGDAAEQQDRQGHQSVNRRTARLDCKKQVIK
jgi:hypothetical protein